jgi:hypothetical protein
LKDVFANSLRLRYNLELDIFGYTDGPSQHPVQERLDYFKRLQKAWLELDFPRKDAVKLAFPWKQCHFHQGAVIGDLWQAEHGANSPEYNRLTFASTITNTPYVESTSPLLHPDYYRCILDTAQDFLVLVRVPNMWPTYVPHPHRSPITNPYASAQCNSLPPSDSKPFVQSNHIPLPSIRKSTLRSRRRA